MPTITSFAQAQDALRPFYDNSRTVYTLDNMRQLMDYLGKPQEKLQVIHIAGTSGKTSTAYYSAALLQGAGKTVGLSVSPHVDTVNERLQINGQLLPESEYCAVLGEFLDIVAESPVAPSYFELLVAMAYWEFARRGLEYAVMEVGLGGLLDGTNVVERADKVCVITDIGLDHTEILGDTVEQIAMQKAGIIKSGNVAFMCAQDQSIVETIQQYANSQPAQLNVLPRASAISLQGLPLFQQRNLGLAAAAVNFVLNRNDDQSLTDQTIIKAAKLTIPARLERFQIGDKTVIVDGSHNQQKLQTLLTSITDLYPEQPIAVLCSFVSGNDERWQGGLNELAKTAKTLIFTTFHSEQDVPKTSVSADDFVKYCDFHGISNYQVEPEPAAAYNVLLNRPEPVLLVTGSFYLLNHIRPLMVEQS